MDDAGTSFRTGTSVSFCGGDREETLRGRLGWGVESFSPLRSGAGLVLVMLGADPFLARSELL